MYRWKELQYLYLNDFFLYILLICYWLLFCLGKMQVLLFLLAVIMLGILVEIILFWSF